MMRWIVSVAIVLSIAGCASTNSLKPGRGTTFEVRGKSYDEVWKAVVAAASQSLRIVESSKESGTVKLGMTTYGEVVGIWVRPTSNGAPAYTVEVQSLKRDEIQITGQDWTAIMISRIKAELGQ